MKLLVLDVNYRFDKYKNEPIVTIYGKVEDETSRVVEVRGFRPYFYASLSVPIDDEILYEINNIVDNEPTLLRIDIVSRFKPFGYQTSPSEMIKVVMRDPHDTRLWREKIKELLPVEAVFESRYLIQKSLYDRPWYHWDVFSGRSKPTIH